MATTGRLSVLKERDENVCKINVKMKTFRRHHAVEDCSFVETAIPLDRKRRAGLTLTVYNHF